MSISIKRFSSVLGAAVVAIALTPAAGPAHAATFTVNSTADVTDAHPGDGKCETALNNGVCTLRAAVQEVSALGGSHVITLPAGTFTLTIPNPNLDLNRDGVPDDESDGRSGDLDLKPPTGQSLTVTIRGAGKGEGSGATIIDGNGTTTNDRVFDVFGGANVTLSKMTIRNGHPPGKSGGAIRNVGALRVEYASLIRNTASNGGGIRSTGSAGSLTVVDSDFIGNVANEGGGIRTSHTVQINGGTIDGNTAGTAQVQGFGGGVDVDKGARVTINGTKIRNNTSSYKGGGIDNDGSLDIIGGTITGNRAGVTGGGIDHDPATGSLRLRNNTTVASNVPNDCSPGPCSQYVTP